jgi:lipopolysaccharide cholinephosphotransferase
LARFDARALFDFEDTQLYGVTNYDEVLRRMFKNYMEYPPVEKRNSGHALTELSLGNF